MFCKEPCVSFWSQDVQDPLLPASVLSVQRADGGSSLRSDNVDFQRHRYRSCLLEYMLIGVGETELQLKLGFHYEMVWELLKLFMQLYFEEPKWTTNAYHISHEFQVHVGEDSSRTGHESTKPLPFFIHSTVLSHKILMYWAIWALIIPIRFCLASWTQIYFLSCLSDCVFFFLPQQPVKCPYCYQTWKTSAKGTQEMCSTWLCHGNAHHSIWSGQR